ncbi:HD domain-containing protein [Glaciimonas sp. CA11.2]|nr:HD domain-containing protein [Glaciimonas sp. CA11.2]
MDVAAVGAAYLKRSSPLLKSYYDLLKCSEQVFLSWSAFMLSMHDLGKLCVPRDCGCKQLVRRWACRLQKANERSRVGAWESLLRTCTKKSKGCVGALMMYIIVRKSSNTFGTILGENDESDQSK